MNLFKLDINDIQVIFRSLLEGGKSCNFVWTNFSANVSSFVEEISRSVIIQLMPEFVSEILPSRRVL